MDELEYRVPSFLAFEPGPGSPLIEAPDVGIRIAARQVNYDGGLLSFELLATYLFESGFALGFERLADALVFGLEDAERGCAAAAPARDPWKRYPRLAGPNFAGTRALPDGGPSHVTGAVAIPLEVPATAGTLEGPTFYVTAFLQRHVSNTLAFDLATGAVASFLDGTGCEVPVQGVEDEAQEEGAGEEMDEAAILGPELELPSTPGAARPAPPALSLAARKPGTFAAGEPILLDATLALPPDELAHFGPEGWLRSLFAWASRQDSQATRVGHWLGSRTVFADDFAMRTVSGQARAVAAAPFELSQLLEVKLRPGVHYLQASARHHRSNVLEIACV